MLVPYVLKMSHYAMCLTPLQHKMIIRLKDIDEVMKRDIITQK